MTLLVKPLSAPMILPSILVTSLVDDNKPWARSMEVKKSLSTLSVDVGIVKGMAPFIANLSRGSDAVEG